MPIRIVQISAPDSATSTIKDLCEEFEAIDHWHSAKNKDGRRTISVLIHLQNQQVFTDKLQSKLSKEKNWRMVIMPVEATLPDIDEPESKNKNGNETWLSKMKLKVSRQISREELYNEVEGGARTDIHFIVLTLLSSIVAAIGLVNDNIAVIIGAMVIAPLLGPNLSLAFGAALGDKGLMKKAAASNFVGLSMTIAVAALISALMGFPLDSHELMSRTDVGSDTIVLAMAAGAAGVLSLTTGLSGALVGVMVAVALMPPAVGLGLFLGGGEWDNAYGIGLHLATNIVCISLAAQFVFLLSRIRPRTWYKRKKSGQSVRVNIFFWLSLLIILTGLIFIRNVEDSVEMIINFLGYSL